MSEERDQSHPPMSAADVTLLKSKYAGAARANDMKRRLTLLRVYAESALGHLCMAEESLRDAARPGIVTASDIAEGNGRVLDPRKVAETHDRQFKADLEAAARIGVELAEVIGMVQQAPESPWLKLAE